MKFTKESLKDTDQFLNAVVRLSIHVKGGAVTPEIRKLAGLLSLEGLERLRTAAEQLEETLGQYNEALENSLKNKA